MTWTILVLVLGIALYMFGGMLLQQDAKKPAQGAIWAKKAIKVISVIVIAGSVCRLYVPYYLTSVNPMILQEMANGMQEQQNAEKNKAIRKHVRKGAFEMMADAPVLGNPKAEKTIYVWTAASCGYCRRVHNEINSVLANRDDVRVVIKNFSIHGDRSEAPARASIAAKIQSPEKAAELFDMIMTREYLPQGEVKDYAKAVHNNVMKMAKEVGLDVEKLEADMTGEVVARELANVNDLAQQFEITGTPFLIIGEEAFPGAIPASQINQALDK